MLCLLIINRNTPITRTQALALRDTFGVIMEEIPGTHNFQLPGNATEVRIDTLPTLLSLMNTLGPCEVHYRPGGQIPGGATIPTGLTIIALNRNPVVTVLPREKKVPTPYHP